MNRINTAVYQGLSPEYVVGIDFLVSQPPYKFSNGTKLPFASELSDQTPLQIFQRLYLQHPRLVNGMLREQFQDREAGKLIRDLPKAFAPTCSDNMLQHMQDAIQTISVASKVIDVLGIMTTLEYKHRITVLDWVDHPKLLSQGIAVYALRNEYRLFPEDRSLLLERAK